MTDHKLRSKSKDVAMQQMLHFRAEFAISEGKIKQYKKLIKEMSKVLKANEPDTINYQFYLDKSDTRCIVHETYANSEAVFSHINGWHQKQLYQGSMISMIYLEKRDLRFSGLQAKSYRKQWKD